MFPKNDKNQAKGLKTLRLLVEVVESEDGNIFIVRTENGAPIASSSKMSTFLEDVENIIDGFTNYKPVDHE